VIEVLSTNGRPHSGHPPLGHERHESFRIDTSILRPLWLLGWLLGLCLASSLTEQGLARESVSKTEPPLIDQQPFDLINLNAANGGASIKVFPVPFADRRVPDSPSPQDKLRVVLVRFPEREYEVLWRDIARVELYEQRIYDEAQSKLAGKDFIGAFQNLSFLLKKYPQMPRLEELRQEFLLKSAADRYQAGEFRQTLSALEELRSTAPNFQATTVLRVLSQVADGLITDYQQAGDLASAQQLLNRLRTTYGQTLPVIANWEKKLQEMAQAKQGEAFELLSRQEYRRARQAATAMLSILPDAQQAQEIIEQINREHPMVRVGVMQRSFELDATSLVDWGARRAGMLVQQPIFQFLETGAEGGRYGFALGTYRASDDRQQLILSLDPNVPQPLGAFGLAQLLLARSDPDHPDYDPTWAAIFQAVSIPSANQVLVQLRRPNVLPHALLQWTVADDLNQSSDANPSDANPMDTLESAAPLLPGPYRLESQDDQEASFVSRQPTEPAGQPREVIEIFYEDPKLAVNDLLRGEIDVLDQLYPADAQRLSSDPRLTVGTYALPTIHMLIPLSDDPFLANVKFRRALLYATNRQGVLTGELLSSSDPNDGRLVSGPFPLGGGVNDPLSYAYNKSIQPVEFNPQLAKLLLVMTQQELRESAKRTRQPEPKLQKLIVGCPDYELARVAVQAMIQQWANVGIEAEMLVQSMEEAFVQKCDLIYVTTNMWEPATDIQRLLGGNGVAATENPFIVQALETLRAARNWREVRTALQDLHQLIDYHLPVLPLWQIADRFAIRNYVEGVENRPISLYQNVTTWRVNFGQLQITAK
jgi:ABC-type transport system substrate-binding protein/tetratricopeptide (TPR) repeat protein